MVVHLESNSKRTGKPFVTRILKSAQTTSDQFQILLAHFHTCNNDVYQVKFAPWTIQFITNSLDKDHDYGEWKQCAILTIKRVNESNSWPNDFYHLNLFNWHHKYLIFIKNQFWKFWKLIKKFCWRKLQKPILHQQKQKVR